jgi:tryptophanyl-tRNA synthetase
MARVFSGIQPSGSLHIGNYIGALRQWVVDQYDNDAIYCIVDMHALTIEHDPEELRARTIETAVTLLAAGLSPETCILFAQSHVPEHAELAWLLECTASMGELRRMTQFKEKGAGQESVRVGLLTYPVLMAADILLYQTDKVPVGDDQRQHLELARDLAIRFNSRYGATFVVPEAEIPKIGARVMDLQQPGRKMSKSVSSPQGTINLADEPDEIRRKIRRAVTDADGEVRYDPEQKPGVANLLELLSVATARSPEDLAGEYSSYATLKDATAEGIVALLEPVQQRVAELMKDPAEIERALGLGADKARALASPTLERARHAIGLTSRHPAR